LNLVDGSDDIAGLDTAGQDNETNSQEEWTPKLDIDVVDNDGQILPATS